MTRTSQGMLIEMDAKTLYESDIKCARCDEYLDSNRPLCLTIPNVSFKMVKISRTQSHSPRMHTKTNQSEHTCWKESDLEDEKEPGCADRNDSESSSFGESESDDFHESDYAGIENPRKNKLQVKHNRYLYAIRQLNRAIVNSKGKTYEKLTSEWYLDRDEEYNVITEKEWHKIGRPKIYKTRMCLTTSCGEDIGVRGKVRVRCYLEGNRMEFTAFLVTSFKDCLISFRQLENEGYNTCFAEKQTYIEKGEDQTSRNILVKFFCPS